WCKSTGFLSMLPEDANARRKEVLEKEMEQTQVDKHFHPVDPDSKPLPYTDDRYIKEAAIQWLIETDQSISAFEHPSFQHMIHLASRATRSIKIPNRKQMHDKIITLFKMQMTKLKDCLNI
ncbi:hypothetical protein B0F90DRAFT_1582275, partial [Multifurca ochricompacta]